MYAEAFPGEDDPLTYLNTQKAIAVFERTLLTPSPFDDYLNGNDAALNAQQKQGLKDFMDVGCITCHMGVLLGGNMYHKFGIYDAYWKHTKSKNIDEGLATVSGDSTQKFMFKVPSLRNIEKTFPYYHDGSVESLNEAIQIMAVIQLNKELTDTQIADIGAFLESLTGTVPEKALLKK